jgi:hypothetical protein
MLEPLESSEGTKHTLFANTLIMPPMYILRLSKRKTFDKSPRVELPACCMPGNNNFKQITVPAALIMPLFINGNLRKRSRR